MLPMATLRKAPAFPGNCHTQGHKAAHPRPSQVENTRCVLCLTCWWDPQNPIINNKDNVGNSSQMEIFPSSAGAQIHARDKLCALGVMPKYKTWWNPGIQNFGLNKITNLAAGSLWSERGREPWNYFGWKRPPRSRSPASTTSTTDPCPQSMAFKSSGMGTPPVPQALVLS